MARGRFISNSISTSKKFARLQSNDHRLAYIMLIPHVDAEGRHDADTRILAGQVYTLLDLTHDQINAALQDMHHVGLVRLYSVGGERYLEVVNFHEHNKVRRRDDGTPSHEAASTIPPPSDSNHKSGETTEELRSGDVPPTAQVEVKAQVQVKDQVQEPRAHAREAGARQEGKKGNPPKGKGFDPTKVPLPEFVSPDVWRDYADHRRDIGKPLTERAAKLTLEDLAEHPTDADEMLRISIKRGWTGVFPLDKARDGARTGPAATAWDQILDVARKEGKPPDGLDARTKAALQAVGGWSSVAYCPNHLLGQKRAKFLDAYDSYDGGKRTKDAA